MPLVSTAQKRVFAHPLMSTDWESPSDDPSSMSLLFSADAVSIFWSMSDLKAEDMLMISAEFAVDHRGIDASFMSILLVCYITTS